MTKGRRATALVLLVAALALAVVGQLYFFHRRDYLWDGLAFHVLAAACFFSAWRIARVRPRAGLPGGQPAARPGPWWRGLLPEALLVAGLLLTVLAALLARGRLWNQSTYDTVVLWALGLVAATAAAFWPAAAPASQVDPDSPPTGSPIRPVDPFAPSPAPAVATPDVGPGVRVWRRLAGEALARLQGVSKATWREVGAVVALTALALALRATALSHIPYTVGGDEAWHGLLARQVLDGQLRNPFSMGYMSMPTFFYWPLSWSLRLVEDGPLGLRLPAALVGTLTVPALYLLARRLWGAWTAFLAALFLAAYDYHIHFSRLGANNIWDPFLAVLVLWLLEIGLVHGGEAGRRRSFVLAGLVMGFGVYFYTGARLLPLLAAAYLACAWLQRRSRGAVAVPGEGLGRPLLWLALAFLVAAGPMLGYALAHPAEWNARINQIGILQSGWLAREPGLTGKTTTQILAEQFLRSAGAFHVFPDRTGWYGADRPLLGFLAGIPALLGMVWAAAHGRQRRYFLVLAWFWAVIIGGGMLTESPPSSQRLVMAVPPVVLLVAIGLEQTAGLAHRLFVAGQEGAVPGRRRAPARGWQRPVVAALIAALAVGSVGYYFLKFTPSRRYGTANGETATMIGYYLRGLGDGYHAYLLGAPRIYWSFGTMAFLAPAGTGEDLAEPVVTPPEPAGTGGAVVFIALTERAGELPAVQRALPGGLLREFSDTKGELRFLAYELSP